MDEGTALLLQPALAAICHHIAAFEKRGVSIAEAGRHWKLLAEFLRAAGLAPERQPESGCQHQEVPALLDHSSQSRAGNPNCAHKSTADGVF